MPKKTFEKAEKSGAIFITQTKDNQKNLHKQLQHGCSIGKPLSVHTDDHEKHHGRIEQRTYEVFDTCTILKKWPEWKNIRCVIRVIRTRTNAASPYKTVTSAFYYVSNKILPAQEFSQYIRNHWWIENKVHHVRDATFKEDYCVKRENPFVFATLISFALNIMRFKNVVNIKKHLYKYSLDIDGTMKYFSYL